MFFYVDWIKYILLSLYICVPWGDLHHGVACIILNIMNYRYHKVLNN